MVRNAGMVGHKFDQQQIQAAFDFLPQDMRHRLRFGDVLRAGRADLRNQSRLIDRQVVGLGSRIAAARLREILRPDSERPACEPGAQEPEAPSDISGQSPADLAEQREILREIGTAVFYFRDEYEAPSQTSASPQRLHPRPLPARYYGAPPQQAGAATALDDAMPAVPQRRSA